MTASEDEILRDQNERNNLQKAISELETAIVVSSPGTRRVLELSLAGAKARVSKLDKKIDEAKIEHAAEVQAQVAAAAALAAKETALSASERETYKGFLQESCFTKKDLGRLDEFYTHSYDRLSEGGKEEMSKRIHEGINRGEFKFTDLSKFIQEKDNEHCSAKAKKETSAREHINKSNNLSSSAKPVERTAVNDIDLSSVDLKGIQLVAATSEPTPASIPNASERGANGRS